MQKINYKDYISLENCKDEPISFLGAIQEFGCLLVFNEASDKLIFCSENTLDYFDVPPKSLLDESVKSVSAHFEPELKLNRDTSFYFLKNMKVFVNSYVKNGLVYVEIEELTMSEDYKIDYLNQTKELIKSVNKVDEFQDFSELIAKDIRKITGYDRVMIYKFDSDFNGEVFAEAKRSDLDPFLGLNYPHTDIPSQARELYKKNTLRILTNVDYTPQVIVTNNEGANYKSLDLGDSILRAVSPIHIKYLKNMGVVATLTISIMIDEQLWGLVSCHHYSQRYLGHDQRLAAELYTGLYASQIRRWEQSDEYAKVQEKEHIYQAIIEDAIEKKDLFKAISETPYFTGLTSSTGGVVIRGKNLHYFGYTPTKEQILEIHSWMKEKNESVFLTNEFSSYNAKAEKYKDSASGVLYYRLDNNSNSAVIWFRRQQSEGKKWGGKPTFLNSKAAEKLTPRNSFEAWEEEVEGKSLKWMSHEIQAGLRLCAYLEREIYIRNITEQKKQFQLLTEDLKAKNEELSQFNWISSHDMKEPLRKIRLFVDQIKENQDVLSETHQLFFTRIDASAERMQLLIDDLLNYSSINKKINFDLTDISKLIENVKKEYLNGECVFDVELKNIEKLPVIDFQISQLFSNLISNAIKFRHSERDCKISIYSESVKGKELSFLNLKADKEYVKIVVEDNGIGFEEEYNEKIFQMFQRLHKQKDYSGTGIGLAICKKIIETHQGGIRAYGSKGKGAKFEVFLPKTIEHAR